MPPDDPRHGVRTFADELQKLINQFGGPEWGLPFVEIIGMLEVAKANVIKVMHDQGKDAP